MGGPAGMPDAGFANQRFMHQKVTQFIEFSNCPAPVKLTPVKRADPRTVIAAIFKPP